MSSFAHLHVHTQYSLLDGAARISELTAKAREFGMTALAMTDHGVMYGMVEFYKACKKAGIKPILGIEAYVAPRRMEDKEGVREYSHLILLAKNNEGLKNIMRLSTMSFTKGFHYKPRIDYDVLESHKYGVICLSACLAGDIPHMLLNNRDDEAHALALRLKNMFGGDFYIELQNHGLKEQLIVLPKLNRLACELGIKTVATNDIHYVNRDDAKYQDVLLCVQTGRYIDDENRMRMDSDEFYLKSEEEMLSAFSEYSQAVYNTSEVADKCNVTLDFETKHMPVFTAPDGQDNISYFKSLCNEGLRFRRLENNPDAVSRLEYEQSVIIQMGFVDYFLIVYDFIVFARSRDIVIGPGRGSGVGSLVSYCLRITDVNPLKYSLLFERLLNPERVSMPDLDIDMCIERRQEVIDYVSEKYGHDHVAQITTFGAMMAKAAIKDVGRAMKFPPAFTDRLASYVPPRLDVSLSDAINESKELADLIKEDAEVARLMEYARRLEGLQRHASTHAAGVVITPEPITEYVPLQVTKDVLTTQVDMRNVEELGLLKMDFLGLRTLTVIRYALELIKRNGKVLPDLDSMEYDDPAVYAMISKGDTAAVFQLESSGMRQFMTQLNPECFEDIIAGISLYRPGPMDRIPDYLRGKQNKENIDYPDERLRSVLEPTYGVMVYQEQVMQIVRDLAGYSMGRSDLVRRAMAKKKHDVMKQERHYFLHGIEENGEVKVPGAIRNGVPKAVAEKTFDEMMDFASYAFNKSHAAAYAVLAYKTAYLKLYYPAEFMTAIINSYLGATDKVAEYIYFCKSNGIPVLPPDINKSVARFTTEGNGIRMGLAGIRNVGEAAVNEIISEREAHGKFADFRDFVCRSESLNKRMVESLIKAGSFLSLGLHRSQLLAVYETVMEQTANERKQRAGGQMLLFDLTDETSTSSVSVHIPDIKEYDDRVLSMMEKSVIGLYLTKHPLNDYNDCMQYANISASEIMNADENSNVHDGATVKLLCMIHTINKRKSKAGSLMATGSFEDTTGVVDFLAFPTVLAAYENVLQPEKVLYVTGRISLNSERGNALIVDEVRFADTLRDGRSQRLYLKLKNANDIYVYSKIKDTLKHYPGSIPVIIFDESTGKKSQAPDDMRVNLSPLLLNSLKQILGEENVRSAVK